MLISPKLPRSGYCAVRAVYARLAYAATGAVCQCRRIEPQTDGGAPILFGSLRYDVLRVAGTGIERWNFPMPKFGGRTRLMSVGGVVLAGLIAVLGVVIFGRAAGAHTAELKGTAACQNDGTFTITYTLDLANSGLKADVTRTGMTPA